MYYLEVRFSQKEQENAITLLKSVINIADVISFYHSNYYICYRVKNPIFNTVITSLKNNKMFYFVCYYKL